MATQQAQFVRLGDVWRAQEHENFAAEVQQAKRLVNHVTASRLAAA